MTNPIEDVQGGAAEAPDPVLAKINAALLACGSTAQWMRAPEDLPGYAPLKGRKVLQLDDSEYLLQNFAPDLVVATDGNFTPYWYQEQNVEDIVAAIIASGAEIVLMDYSLGSDSIDGAILTRALKQAGFAGKIIGFSSEREGTRNFTAAGADGFIKKESSDPPTSIVEVANLVKASSF